MGGGDENRSRRKGNMTVLRETPYVCHVFVCTNDRRGVRKSCADGDSPALRAALKGKIADRGWKPRVRVSQSGCLGLCAQGPNVVIYPQKIWFSQVGMGDIPVILQKIEELLETG